MSAETARIVTLVSWSYVAVGVVFAIGFLAIGVRVVEPKARGGSLLFHVLIFPGCVALWPILTRMWLRARVQTARSSADSEASSSDPPAMRDSERTRHFWMWAILGPIAVAILIAALLFRQEPATDAQHEHRDKSGAEVEGGQR